LKTDDLRSFLKQKLPDYMVPSIFVFVDALPLTPNGKVDRKALPAPEQETLFVLPRTAAEETIRKIWAEVLQLEQVGIHDDFFTLGGHSLLAIQVMSRLRQAFHMELPLRSLFENPTVALLAANINQSGSADRSPEILRILTDLEALSDDRARDLLRSTEFI
jgi:acyl carrier protein